MLLPLLHVSGLSSNQRNRLFINRLQFRESMAIILFSIFILQFYEKLCGKFVSGDGR